jgi:hypothetical protein
MAGFVLGKTFDSIQNLFSTKNNLELTCPPEEKTKIFDNFVVKETEKELNFYDKGGYEIFTIEK